MPPCLPASGNSLFRNYLQTSMHSGALNTRLGLICQHAFSRIGHLHFHFHLSSSNSLCSDDPLSSHQSYAVLIVPGSPAPCSSCPREGRATESVVPLYVTLACALLQGGLVLHYIYFHEILSEESLCPCSGCMTVMRYHYVRFVFSCLCFFTLSFCLSPVGCTMGRNNSTVIQFKGLSRFS